MASASGSAPSIAPSNAPSTRSFTEDAVTDLIGLWETEELRDSALLEAYEESVTVDFLASLPPAQLKTLRDHLLLKGVLVRKERGLQIFRALRELIPSEETWDTPTGADPARASRSQIGVANQAQEGPAADYNARARTQRAFHGDISGVPGFAATASVPSATPSNPGVPQAPKYQQLFPGPTGGYEPPGPDTGLVKEILRHFQSEGTKYGGLLNDDLEGVESRYQLFCDTLAIGPIPRVRAVHAALRGSALTFYQNELKAKRFRNVSEVFEEIRQHYMTDDRKQRALAAWEELSFKNVRARAPDATDADVVDALVTEATRLQKQLGVDYAGDVLLRDRIRSSVKDERFANLLSVAPSKTSRELVERIQVAIQAQPPNDGTQDTYYAANRQYQGAQGTARKNPIKNGARMKCHGCGSEWHMVNKCTKIAPERLTLICDVLDEVGVSCEQKTEDLTSAMESNSETNSEHDERPLIDVNYVDSSATHTFKGFLIDSGAPVSVCGTQQLSAYKRSMHAMGGDFAAKPVACRTGVRFRFGESVFPSVGKALIEVPFGRERLAHEIHTIESSVPMLLGTDFLSRHGAKIDHGKRTIEVRGQKEILRQKNGHLYLGGGGPLLTEEQSEKNTWFTQAEALKLHNRFGHASVEKIVQLTQRARPGEPQKTFESLRKYLHSIQESCHICQYSEKAPLRPSVAPEFAEHVRFNDEIILDVVHLTASASGAKEPVLHMVCRDTKFSAAVFLKSMTAQAVSAAFVTEWICHFGIPRAVRVDKGSEFIAVTFTTTMMSYGIDINEAGPECHWVMGAGERMHAPLRKLYERLRQEKPSMPPAEMLAIANKTMNDVMNPDGCVPSYLVFGTVPKLLVGDDMMGSPAQNERIDAVKKLRLHHEHLVAREKVNKALSESFPRVTQMSPGDKVRVYRYDQRKWDGPFPLAKIDYQRNLAWVELPRGTNLFSVAVVRPHRERMDALLRNDQETISTALSHVEVGSLDVFEKAKREELAGLKARGVFEEVPTDEVERGANIIGHKWVCKVKPAQNGAPEIHKARLTALGNRDRERGSIVCDAQVVQQISIRLLTTVAVRNGWSIWTRDAIQAYLQSTHHLARKVYMRPPPEYKKETNGEVLLRIVVPIYGLTESGALWGATYLEAIEEATGAQATLDPCLLRASDGVIAVLVDDTLCAGTNAFADKEAILTERFDMKPKKELPVTFSGITMARTQDNGVMFSQAYDTGIENVAKTFNEVRSLRGRLSWLANVTRPDLSYSVAQLAQVSEVNFDAGAVDKTRQRILRHLRRNLNVGMKIPVLHGTLRVIAYSDASFANNPDLSTQLGAVVMLANEEGRATVVAWKSGKSKRVVRSVLGAEICAMSEALDISVYVSAQLKLLGVEAATDLVTDSRSIFDTVVTRKCPSEKRLQIDLSAIRDAFDRGEVARICWCSSDKNIADGLTKAHANELLLEVMRTGTLKEPYEVWVDAFGRKGSLPSVMNAARPTERLYLPTGRCDAGSPMGKKVRAENGTVSEKGTEPGE